MLLIVILYFSIVILLGYISVRKNDVAKDFVLGGRKFNSVTTALGAGASDMSGWLMMAFPGIVYLHGVSELWFPLGLLIGAFLNWKIVAKKLRILTEKYGNALTIPSYLSNRFNDKSHTIRIVSSVVITIFFLIYIASALIALALLLSTFSGIEYKYCLFFGAIFVLIYTSIGGFTAINWIDVMQGTLMLFSLLIVPIAIFFDQQNIYDNIIRSNINISDPFKGTSVVTIISLLCWGLGYFGQPHILVRFMATKTPDTMKTSMKICMTWMFLSLVGAMFVGLFGRLLFAPSDTFHPDTIFLLSASKLFPSWLFGVVLAAVLAAIMSTIAAQLHATSCSIIEDIGFNLNISKRYKLWLTRAVMFIIILIAAIPALDQNNTILNLVSFAWAGLGSAFGPIIIFSLYSKNMTKETALYSMITGGITVIIWHFIKDFLSMKEVYEIIPGFLLGVSVILYRNKRSI
ncbi:MAG: sodium/proline symporter [Candidatus Midichloriaceae bacterium]|jgi:sodium/proline symporter